jgi:hypothetical protein
MVSLVLRADFMLAPSPLGLGCDVVKGDLGQSLKYGSGS